MERARPTDTGLDGGGMRGGDAGLLSLPTALWMYVQWGLEAHGWKLLAALLLFFVGRQKYRAFAAQRHHERTLATANDPARVAVLQRETARVRHKQQQALQAQAIGKRLKPEKAA